MIHSTQLSHFIYSNALMTIAFKKSWKSSISGSRMPADSGIDFVHHRFEIIIIGTFFKKIILPCSAGL